MDGHALLAEWTGPYGGVPAFDKMDLDDLKPALETGMERSLADIDAIADSTEAPELIISDAIDALIEQAQPAKRAAD